MKKQINTSVSRRGFVAGTTALAGSIGFPAILGAQPAAIKVGLIHPVTGFVAYNGQQGRLGGTMAIAASVGVNHNATIVAMMLERTRHHTINTTRFKSRVSIVGPGWNPRSTRTASSRAMPPLDGLPNVIVGMRWPPSIELVALSGAITPRTSPVPHVFTPSFSV